MQLIRVATILLLTSPFMLAEDALKFTQPEIPLWSAAELGTIPAGLAEKWNPSTDGLHRITNVHNPSMFVFLPPKERATGVAVVICPGGGNRYLVMDLEGSFVAEKLNSMGIAAFVLKSRLANAEGSTYKVDVESLQDAQRAIRIIRNRAAEWRVDPARVGIMGFSAGAGIASLAETRYDDATKGSTPLDRLSARPDFAVLGYGSNRNANITKDTPPTFMVVAGDDAPSAELATYYGKLKAARVVSELHIYTRGGHGFGMTGRNAEFKKLPLSGWPERFREWLLDVKILSASK